MNKLLTVALILGGVGGGFLGHDLITQVDFDEFAEQCAARERTHALVRAEDQRYFQKCLDTLESAGATELMCERRLSSCQGRHDL